MASRGLFAVALVALLSGCVADDAVPTPSVLAALGDSITRAANAVALGDRPSVSWATGRDPDDGVWSFAERLRASSPSLRALNLAVSGARVRDLEAQAESAVAEGADVVLVLVGANDACARSVEAMTPTDGFRLSFQRAASVLEAGLPRDAVVFVASVPDVGALWEAGREHAEARAAWRRAGACPALLGDDATDASRAAVVARVRDYNAILGEEARAFGFAHDGGAVFDAKLTLGHVSRIDGFHPSLAGQATLAGVAWNASPYS